jgi:hypothetical protein
MSSGLATVVGNSHGALALILDRLLFRPGISPIRCTPCEGERCCRSPWLCRWSLLLLSRLLSAQALYDGYLLPLEIARTLQEMTRVRSGGRLLPGPWSLTGGGAEAPTLKGGS